MFPRIAVVSGLFSESPRHKEYTMCARRRDPNNNDGDESEDLVVYALRYGRLIYLFSVNQTDCVFLDSSSKAKTHPTQSDLRCDIQLSGVNATVFLYHHFL